MVNFSGRKSCCTLWGSDDKDKVRDPEEDDDWKGSETALLFHPLCTFSVLRKRTQAALLAQHIDVIKRAFNLAFETSFDDKKQKIDMILDRAKKIEDIQSELGNSDSVYRPKLSSEEILDSVLSVADSDIKAQRVLTPEEQKEHDLKMEAERLAKANADDAPERALDDMMNGGLQAAWLRACRLLGWALAGCWAGQGLLVGWVGFGLAGLAGRKVSVPKAAAVALLKDCKQQPGGFNSCRPGAGRRLGWQGLPAGWFLLGLA